MDAKDDERFADAVAYRMPAILQVMVLAFPVFMALASFAALYFFGTTLPGHLGSGAANAP